MSRGTCKECPWVRQGELDKAYVRHSKKHEKKHNCHMLSSDKEFWDADDETVCIGCEQHFENDKE